MIAISLMLGLATTAALIVVVAMTSRVRWPTWAPWVLYVLYSASIMALAWWGLLQALDGAPK